MVCKNLITASVRCLREEKGAHSGWGDGTDSGYVVMETPLILQASRPTHFHTFILHPLMLCACVCTRVSVLEFYKET